MLTAGATPPNPAELLQSRAMRYLLAEVKEHFDIVIIDAPPLLPVTDAALLASEADGALVVLRHSRTTKDQLAGAVERLRAVDAAPLGVIMNMVPNKRVMVLRIRLRARLRLPPESTVTKATAAQRRAMGKQAKREQQAAPPAPESD